MSKFYRSDLLLILAGIFIAVICSELIIRLVYNDKFGKRPIFYVAADELGWKSASDLHHTFYGPDYTMKISTDEDGYRLGRLGRADRSKDLIVLLGDSYTFGWGVHNDETFASFLDEEVDRDSHHRSRVINLGVGGYGSLQNALRLEQLLEKYKDLKIKAVIIGHCSNDLTDNLKSAGYQAGVWKMSVLEKERSRFHLINFLNYTAKLLRSGGTSVVKNDQAKDFLEDQLWEFQRATPPILPPEITLNGNTVDLRGFSADDADRQVIHYTQIQKDLFRESVRMIDRLLEGRNVLIVHAFVSTADDEYIREVTALIEEVSGDRNGTVILGRVPAQGSYQGTIENKHSGGHYHPDFNRFWARSMTERLRELGVLKK